MKAVPVDAPLSLSLCSVPILGPLLFRATYDGVEVKPKWGGQDVDGSKGQLLIFPSSWSHYWARMPGPCSEQLLAQPLQAEVWGWGLEAGDRETSWGVMRLWADNSSEGGGIGLGYRIRIDIWVIA